MSLTVASLVWSCAAICLFRAPRSRRGVGPLRGVSNPQGSKPSLSPILTDFAGASSTALSTRARSCRWVLASLTRSLSSQRLTHHATDLPVAHRFSEDGKRPCRSRALPQVVIAVGRNEHDRDLEIPRRQLLLHLKTAHFWHRKVENHAPDRVQSVRPQKLLPRCERLDPEREGPQKQLERVAETLIVVDDGDDASVTLADRIAGPALVAQQLVHIYTIEDNRGGG